jgi:hypothetical protein
MDGTPPQFRLIHDGEVGTLPRDLSHYVPVLQTRPGELQALGKASDAVWEHITPVLVFVAMRREPGADPRSLSTVTGWGKRAAAAVGTHCFYVDLMRADPNEKVRKPNGEQLPLLRAFFEAARRRDLRFIPTLQPASSPDHIQLVAEAVGQYGRGLALRCPMLGQAQLPGNALPPRLLSLAAETGAAPDCTDVLLDLDYLDEDVELDLEALVADILAIHEAGPWRTMALLGSSMPRMLSEIKEGTLGSIHRREWALWSQLAESGMSRVPVYGDYAVQHPTPPSSGGPGMRRNIRYTVADQTLIARGEGDQFQSGNEQYIELCQWIKASGEYSGPAYSWGDGIIDQVASGLLAPGHQPMWRGAGTSHHLQYVIDQLGRRQIGA